jgi:5-methylcytosine-specific restriction endonuclease McrA
MPLSGDAQPYPKDAATQPGRPRRYRRKVASPKRWAALWDEKIRGRLCRVCGEGWVGRTMEAHHLVPRGLGGDDVADNLVAVHLDCHEFVTTGDSGALRFLAESLTDAEYAYCVSKLGETAMQRLFGVER